jgi:transglutaminase-like putative cysteine protease
MKYRVRHVTKYAYKNAVDLASHMLHLTPRALPGQSVLRSSLRVSPDPSRLGMAEDHFGNATTWVFLDSPHERFEATVEAEVDVAFPPPPPAVDTLAWEAVAEAARIGGPGAWQAAEFAFDSPMVAADLLAERYARVSFPPGRPVLAGLLELTGRMRRDFAFRTGVTGVFTPVAKVMAQRAGVCQDFTHVMLSGLRALGLPARYVSGYLRTRPPPGEAPRRGADQSHAWVGAWLGPAHGWVDLDPTNNLVVRDEHVVLAWGRDYGDISPVRGVILGGGRHTVTAAVDLEPLETASV